MDIDMADTLTAFARGSLTLIQVRQTLLRHFLGRRTPSDTLLLADYIEDVALRVRDGSICTDDAVRDLIAVRASEDDRRNSRSACQKWRHINCQSAMA